MMYTRAQTTAYAMAIFVLMSALFVVSNANDSNYIVVEFKEGVRDEFARALIQTVGDQPWFEEVELVWRGINEFYTQASAQTIALFESPESDEELVRIGSKMILAFTKIGNNIEKDTTIGRVAGESIEWNYDPLGKYDLEVDPSTRALGSERGSEFSGINLLPERSASEVEGFMTEEPIYNIVPEPYYLPFETEKPNNSANNPWTTILDPVTNEVFCVAVFNSEINSYSGPCKYDRYN